MTSIRYNFSPQKAINKSKNQNIIIGWERRRRRTQNSLSATQMATIGASKSPFCRVIYLMVVCVFVRFYGISMQLLKSLNTWNRIKVSFIGDFSVFISLRLVYTSPNMCGDFNTFYVDSLMILQPFFFSYAAKKHLDEAIVYLKVMRLNWVSAV